MSEQACQGSFPGTVPRMGFRPESAVDSRTTLNSARHLTTTPHMLSNMMPCSAPSRAVAPVGGLRPRSGRKHCQPARAVLSRDQLDTFYQKGTTSC